MVPKSGKHGDFMACDRYPDCNNTLNVERKETIHASGNITKSNGKDTLIIRQCCLKAAVKYSGQSDTVAAVLVYAEEFEKWVNR